jgi:peptidylprolyl isomerase
MPRRTTQILAALSLLAALTACGNDEDPDSSAEDTSGSSELAEVPDTITVTGEFEKPPKVKWSGEVKVDDLARTIVIEGDGDEVGEGTNVLANIWIGNGTSQEEAYSDFGKPANVLNLGAQTLPALADGLDGTKVGSRVLIASPPEDAWGDAGNSQLKIGNTDTVVFVVDLVGTLPDGPDGTDKEPAAWAPTVVEKDGTPTSLDFTDTPAPSGELEVTTLVEGNGEKVKKGQTVYVNYLGQVPSAKEPFDESYSGGQPFSFTVGGGQVIKGWDQALVGVPVGSRVIIQVPPDLGYGKEGQPSVGIKGTDTMYFLVDVLAAS